MQVIENAEPTELELVALEHQRASWDERSETTWRADIIAGYGRDPYRKPAPVRASQGRSVWFYFVVIVAIAATAFVVLK